VEETISALQSKINNFSFIIMSDHGMVPVEKTANIGMTFEKETRIKPLKDYIPYIGSTFASFYIFNEKAESVINELLHSIGEYGKVLSKEEVEMLGINKELYGHIIFALNEKIVFYPNFFQKKEIPRGMHGYAFSRYDNAIFITTSDIYYDYVSLSLKHTEVFGMILKILGINKNND
jgi:hypothetical protein